MWASRRNFIRNLPAIRRVISKSSPPVSQHGHSAHLLHRGLLLRCSSLMSDYCALRHLSPLT
ncbi:hypothetical protein BSP99_06635 [Corynebacterium glutamicum]|nr:hypothetical protein BSP99_06635 [Corynebacterium glutamicum]